MAFKDDMNDLIELIHNSSKVLICIGEKLGSYELDEFSHDDIYFQQKNISKLINEIKKTGPLRVHELLKDICELPQIKWVVNSNVDNYMQLSGCNKIINYYGNIENLVCSNCKSKYNLRKINVINCLKCDSPLDYQINNFGEVLPEEKLELWKNLALDNDLCIVIGSNLRLNPFSNIARVSALKSNKLIIIGEETTNLDDLALINIKINAEIALKDLRDQVIKIELIKD